MPDFDVPSTVDHRTSGSADEGGGEGESNQQSALHFCPHCHRSPAAAAGGGGHFGADGSHSGDDCCDDDAGDGAGALVEAAGVDVDDAAVVDVGWDGVHSLRLTLEL